MNVYHQKNMKKIYGLVYVDAHKDKDLVLCLFESVWKYSFCTIKTIKKLLFLENLALRVAMYQSLKVKQQ